MAEEKKTETRTTHSAAPVGGERIDVRRTETVEHDNYTDATNYGRAAAAVKRVSWGAIFAGAVITLVTQLALSV